MVAQTVPNQSSSSKTSSSLSETYALAIFLLCLLFRTVRPLTSLLALKVPGAAGIHGTLSENPAKTHYFEQYTTSERTIKKS